MRSQCLRWDVNREKNFVAAFVWSSSLHETVEYTSIGDLKGKGCPWD